MDKMEKIIKQYLGENLNKTERTADCLNEQVLIDYFQRKLDKENCRNVEKHLVGCEFCRSQLDLIFQAGEAYKRGKGEKVPEELVKKAQALLKAGKVGAGLTPTRRKGLFLVGAIVFFIASFFVPKYFFQCLVVTLILGMRWAFESEGGRTLIMVIDSWRRHSHDQNDEISNRLKDKFPSARR